MAQEAWKGPTVSHVPQPGAVLAPCPGGAALPSEVLGHGDRGEAKAEPRILAPKSHPESTEGIPSHRAPHQTLSPRGGSQHVSS